MRTPPVRRWRIVRQLRGWLIRRSALVLAFFIGLSVGGSLLAAFTVPAQLQGESPAVEMLIPSDGSAVDREISVEVETRTLELDEYVVIFVRPMPADPNQDYFAQETPVQIDDHRWGASPVFVGSPDDPAGLPFRVCAVITRSETGREDRLPALPPGQADCVDVTRS